MIQLTDKIFCVEVPDGAKNFRIDMGYLIYKVPNYKVWVTDDILADYRKLQKHLEKHKGEDDYKTGGTPLPPGSGQFLFTTKGCTEEDCETIVESFIAGDGVAVYRDYECAGWVKSAVGSFLTLLKSKGCDINRNHAIILKQDDNG